MLDLMVIGAFFLGMLAGWGGIWWTGTALEKRTDLALGKLASLGEEIERSRLKLQLAEDAFIEDAFKDYRERLVRMDEALHAAFVAGQNGPVE